MEHAKQLLSLPVATLVPSHFNVRRYAHGQIDELAALIASQGLLQNLLVTEQQAGASTSAVQFAVVAGERRRRALLLLQQRGQLPADHAVLCEQVAPERAREVSLAENSGREAMHPADEFDAFKALIDGGKGIEDIAARFGVSPLTVQRRLKLSTLSPRLLALYRADGISLDQLMALAISDDTAAQERTWFDAQPWDRTPAALRRRLTASDIEAAGSALVRFVGIDAYEAAGGIVRRDLFDDAQSRFLSDPTLLERLAMNKLEALADTLRDEGWKWVEARLTVDSQALRQFTPGGFGRREPTRAERDALGALVHWAAELARQMQALEDADEWSPDEAEVIDLEEQDIAARRKAIEDGLRTWAPDVKALAGVIVTISRGGDPEMLRGLVREADRRAYASGQAGHARPSEVVPSFGAGGTAGRGATTVSEDVRPACSEALSRRLAAHRSVALQAMLIGNAQVALAGLVHALVLRTFGAPYPREATVFHLVPQTAAGALEAVADDLKAGKAWQTVEAKQDAWRGRLPTNQGAWLPWLIDLSQAELIELLVLCCALTVNAPPATGVSGNAGALAAALGLDMADWWEATAEGYLNHVPKAQIVQALKEAGPGLADSGTEALKKGDLVATAAKRLAGTRWLPQSLRADKT